MKNFKFLLLLLTANFSFTGIAQLYVQPNGPAASFVFVDDTFIYVDQDVNLVVNSNSLAESSIILRNQAQLLQGNGADPMNKGTGDISIFQEGTVNLWDYNFWASPVGLSFDGPGTAAPNGNSVFASRDTALNGFTSTVLFNPVNLVESNNLLLDPGFDSTTGTTQPFRFATYWLWYFESGVGYADWIQLDDIGTLPAGFGFSMKGVNGLDTTDAGDGVMNNDGDLTNGTGQRYDFRGRPNNGDISVSVGPDSFSLVGNPYPSALDLNYFLLENSGGASFTVDDINGNMTSVTPNGVSTGTAYFWESDPMVMSHFTEDYQGGYATYSPLMDVNMDGMYVNATFYMYDENGNQIGTTGGIGDPSLERRFSPVGQGFMVLGSGTGGDVTFKNNHRIFVQEGNNSDFRNNEDDSPIPGIGVASYYPDIAKLESDYARLKIGIGINDTYSRQLGIALLRNATEGYDIAGDAQLGGLASDVSFVIEEEKGYLINAAPIDEYQYLPITIDAETPSEFRFRVNIIENFEYESVFLLDKLTETYYDILEESVLIQLDAGEHNDRFFIRFSKESADNSNDDTSNDDDTTTTDDDTSSDNTSDDDSTLIVSEIVLEEGILETLTVFQNNPTGQLEIHNPLEVNLDGMSLFDVTGKLVLTQNDLGLQSVYSFPTRSLSTGIYIVQFNTTEGFTKSQKISISN